MDMTDYPVLIWNICSRMWQQDLEVKACDFGFLENRLFKQGSPGSGL